MTIRVRVIVKDGLNVDIPVDSLEEIWEEKMSIKDSDKIIKEAILTQHGYYPDSIISVNEIL